MILGGLNYALLRQLPTQHRVLSGAFSNTSVSYRHPFFQKGLGTISTIPVNGEVKGIKRKVSETEETHTRPPAFANISTHTDNLTTSANESRQEFSCAFCKATSTFTDLGSPTKSVVASVVTDELSRTSPSRAEVDLNPNPGLGIYINSDSGSPARNTGTGTGAGGSYADCAHVNAHHIADKSQPWDMGLTAAHARPKAQNPFLTVTNPCLKMYVIHDARNKTQVP